MMRIWETITLRAVLLAAAAATGAAQMSPGMEVAAGIRPRVATVGIETAVDEPTSFPLGSAFSTVPGVRPLTIEFFGSLPNRDAVTNSFVVDELLPAATAVLARSVQVSRATCSSLSAALSAHMRWVMHKVFCTARRSTGAVISPLHALGCLCSDAYATTTRHDLLSLQCRRRGATAAGGLIV